MAYNKIIPITTRLDRSINYVINPEKTLKTVLKYAENDNKTVPTMFVTAFNCDKDTAYADMIATQKRWKKADYKNSVLAYHLIQSFPQNTVSDEEAHQYGKEFIERYLADQYEVVISTHLDKKNLHNHIVFNSVSFMNGKKYRNNFKDYFIDIRGISDMISKDHGLPVIAPKGKGKHYTEWKAGQDGKPSIRSVIRQEIDEIIKQSYTFKSFIELLQLHGYTVKYGERVKYIAIKPPDSQKYIRLKSLGENYTEENIKLRLEAQRKGIRQLDIIERKPQKRYILVKSSWNSFKPKKLKGFVALYYRYMYLLGKIKKRKAPKKVSFLLREEILKFEHYKRQFRFLYSNNIETQADFLNIKNKLQSEINSLIHSREELYSKKKSAKTEILQDDFQVQITSVNKYISELRKDVRLCENIEKDITKISQKFNQISEITEIEKNAKEEKYYEHKWRSSRFNG